MEKEQFEEIREFARSLNEKRQLMPDGQLLDQCQQYLDALVAALTDEFEEAPHENATEPEPEPELPRHVAPELPPEPEPEVRHHPHVVQHQQHHRKGPTKKGHR